MKDLPVETATSNVVAEQTMVVHGQFGVEGGQNQWGLFEDRHGRFSAVVMHAGSYPLFPSQTHHLPIHGPLAK